LTEEHVPSQRRDRPGIAPGSLTARLVRAGAYHGAVPLSRPAFAWLAVAAWAALIFALSSIPNLGTGLEGWDLALRKVAHLAEYAVLGALLTRALATASPSQRVTTVAGAQAWILGAVYAATDELHQHFVPGRQASGIDLLIDAVGVAAGVIAVRLASR
jgi:VanZ family protein